MRFPVLLLAILCAIAVCAQAPTRSYGMLRGTVTSADDGSPFAGATVQVRAGALTVTFVTKQDGSFTGISPAGDVTISVLGQTSEATITTGDETRVALLIRRTGMTLTLEKDEGVPEIEKAFLLYTPAAARENTVAGIAVDAKSYWFPGVPPQAREVTVFLRPKETGLHWNTVRLHWAFTKDAPLRALTARVKRPELQAIRIVDAQGHPLPNLTLRGRLTSECVDWFNAPSTQVNELSTPLLSLKTDGQGYLRLGLNGAGYPPGRYWLALATDDNAGRRVPFEIGADGQASIDRYVLDAQPRDVTQTVFGKDDKPLPHAEVSATYCWQDLAYTLHATADADGKIVWKGVPPVRLLVWGPRVALGVLPAEVTEVTTPLPPLTCWTQYAPLFSPTVARAVPEPVRWWRVTGTPWYQETEMGETVFAPGSSAGLRLGQREPRVGERISAIILTKASPSRVAYLDDAVMPINEYGQTVQFPLTFQSAPEIRGRLVRHDGRPLPGVSRLGIAPADVGSVPQLLRQPELVKLGLMSPVATGDGGFTVRVPVAGAYRLLVDFYDEKTPSPPALRFTVAPGINTVTVKLPAPLITVPAGTVVRGIRRQAPASPTFLTVTAHAPTMPVFGPRESLFALAYRTAPDTLNIWTAQRPVQTLKLRDVTLSFRNAQGQPYQGRIALLPLLPLSREELVKHATPEVYTIDTLHLYLNGTLTHRLQLWPGTYIVHGSVRAGRYEMTSATFTVPAQGTANLVVSMGKEITERDRQRSMVVTLPRADYAHLRRTAAEKLTLAYDVSSFSSSPSSVDVAESFTITDFPERATKLSLTWLGVGTARDLPLKLVTDTNTQGRKYSVTVPAWEPGTTVSGFVLQENGEPYAKRPLVCSLGDMLADGALKVTTDELGGFLIKGIPAGTLCIYPEEQNGPPCGWSLEVPPTGVRQVLLRKAWEPIRRTLRSCGSNQHMWWVPNDGPARRLPNYDSYVACYDAIPAQAGWLWTTCNNAMGMQCLYLTLTPTSSNLSQAPNDGGPLGIYLSGDIDSVFMAGVTLEGLGRLSAIRMEFPGLTWQPISMLGITATQLDSVPPGQYRVTVDAPWGKLTGTVTVTEYGGAIELRPPATR